MTTEGDRPWLYRLSGVYELPYEVFLSGTWQFQAGPPETTTVLVTNQTIPLAQGNQAVQVAPVGDVRFPEHRHPRPEFQEGAAAPRQAKAFLRDWKSSTRPISPPSGWVTQAGPTYHLPSGLQRGRLIKLELAYDF